MALLSLQNASVGYGRPYLLDNVNLQIEAGERIALMGRNGVGKTTLLRVINHELALEQGHLTCLAGLRTTLVEQQVPDAVRGSVYDMVASGFKAEDRTEGAHHLPGLAFSDPDSQAQTSEWESTLPADLSNHSERWQSELAVDNVLARMKLDPRLEFSTLSAGLKRRVLVARALVFNPDILLLDEPTNHLDIDAISWLEEFLLSFTGALVFVSHDRMFVRKLATRVVELDQRTLLNWDVPYDLFLERKEANLEIENQQWAVQDRKMAEEEQWIRKGVKARRKRNQGRVRALQKMRQIRRERFERTGLVSLTAQDAERTGNLVIEAQAISFGYAEQPLINQFSAVITRHDKIGIIGPNGCGKTTLLKLLLGDLAPVAGIIRYGTKLQIAYFDQLREQLDYEKSVVDNVLEGADIVTINGKPKQILAYLIDFLFTPDRARHSVKTLSGGERNRLLLAKLFTNPFNVLVMDEPTNDLDAETLELLEELLAQYEGTVLVVSHDREFLNNVVTSTFVFESAGMVAEYVGGYDDWLRMRPKPQEGRTQKKVMIDRRELRKAEKPRKLTFAQRKELTELPRRIEQLETEQQEIFKLMADPRFYQTEGREVAKVKLRLHAIEQELVQAFSRWEELENLDHAT